MACAPLPNSAVDTAMHCACTNQTPSTVSNCQTKGLDNVPQIPHQNLHMMCTEALAGAWTFRFQKVLFLAPLFKLFICAAPLLSGTVIPFPCKGLQGCKDRRGCGSWNDSPFHAPQPLHTPHLRAPLQCRAACCPHSVVVVVALAVSPAAAPSRPHLLFDALLVVPLPRIAVTAS